MARYSQQQDETVRKQSRMLPVFLPDEDVVSFAMKMAGTATRVDRRLSADDG